MQRHLSGVILKQLSVQRKNSLDLTLTYKEKYFGLLMKEDESTVGCVTTGISSREGDKCGFLYLECPNTTYSWQ